MQSKMPSLVVTAVWAALMASPSPAQDYYHNDSLTVVPDGMGINHPAKRHPAKRHPRRAAVAPSATPSEVQSEKPPKPYVRQGHRHRRIGSGSPIVPPPVPIGPAPSPPGVPAYTPPAVVAPVFPSFCVTRGQSFSPSTGYQTGAGICP